MDSARACARRRVESSLPVGDEKGEPVSPPDPTDPDARFPKSWRLTRRAQFLAVYSGGRRRRSGSFVMFGLPNDVGHCRLGLTVTRKIGSAVVRNRAKRLMRETFRQNRRHLSGSFDLVVNAYGNLLTDDRRETEREFLRCYRQIVRTYTPG